MRINGADTLVLDSIKGHDVRIRRRIPQHIPERMGQLVGSAEFVARLRSDDHWTIEIPLAKLEAFQFLLDRLYEEINTVDTVNRRNPYVKCNYCLDWNRGSHKC